MAFRSAFHSGRRSVLFSVATVHPSLHYTHTKLHVRLLKNQGAQEPADRAFDASATLRSSKRRSMGDTDGVVNASVNAAATGDSDACCTLRDVPSMPTATSSCASLVG